MGDFDPRIGVCTDVIIRVLRGVGIDSQALLFENIYVHPKHYPKIAKPDTNIEHRRTRNLKIWFDRHALKLTDSPPADSVAWHIATVH